MRPRHFLFAVALISTLHSVVRADEEYDQLKARLQAEMQKFYAEGDDVAKKVGWTKRSFPPTPEQSRAMQKRLRPPRDTPRIDFQDEFLAYAEKHKGKPEAIEAWAMVMTMSRCSDTYGGLIETSITTNAFERLAYDHADHPDIVLAMDVIRGNGHCLRFDSLEWLYKVIEIKNKDPEIIAKAQLARAELHQHSGMHRGFDWLHNATPEEKLADEKAAEEILRGLARDYPKTAAGKSADGELFRKEHLAIGQRLRDFEGKDFSGKLVQLSQFRGKVVMVVFWASWCGPCMQSIPEEREMAEKFLNRPFTILGVNCDHTRAAFRKVMAKEALPWPNIFDGDPKTGPIVNALRINAFPTVILLDHEGVIRFQPLYGEQLKKAISELVGKVPTSKGSSSQPAESLPSDGPR